MSQSVLVLGIGNLLLEDEGIGPRAIEELSRRYRFSPEVKLLEGGTAGFSLLPRILEADRLLVLDAIRAGAPAGSLLTLDGSTLPPASSKKLSPHEIGLADVLAVARLYGGPKEIAVLGVEPESLNLGIELSPKVSQALEKLIEAVIEQLATWGVPAERLSDRPAPAAPGPPQSAT